MGVEMRPYTESDVKKYGRWVAVLYTPPIGENMAIYWDIIQYDEGFGIIVTKGRDINFERIRRDIKAAKTQPITVVSFTLGRYHSTRIISNTTLSQLVETIKRHFGVTESAVIS